MPESYMIYLYLKQIVKNITGISATYNDIESNKQNVISINVTSPTAGTTRKLATGASLKRTAFVTIIYHSNKDKAGILKTDSDMEKLRDIFETTHNKFVYFKGTEISDKSDFDVYLSIGQTDLMSDIINLGKNEFEIPRKSIRIKINYIKGGN